jgi:hypothetical protein
VLNNVVPIHREKGAWLVTDGDGLAVPLGSRDEWKLLALAGGQPIDLAGEWNGESFRPLGVQVDGQFHLLGQTQG